jgi:D-sedoheptulose 7-phosphate isomerase
MTFPENYRKDLIDTFGRMDLAGVSKAIDWLHEAREKGNAVFICGNGGSAATSSHFVVDMLKGASMDREKRFRIMALNDQMPTLTAYANDVSYDCVFVEQLKNFAKRDDVFIALSGSGNSPNVLKAMEYANATGCKTIAMTGGDGGKLAPQAKLDIRVPSCHMGRIEDGHMIVCHMICYYFMEGR